MARAAKKADRQPSQRKDAELRKAEAVIAGLKLHIEALTEYICSNNTQRNCADRRLQRVLAVLTEDQQLELAQRDPAILEIGDAKVTGNKRELELTERTKRVKSKIDATAAAHPDPPPGCTVYRRAVPLDVIESELSKLEASAASKEAETIKAQQTDDKRKQVKLEKTNPVVKEMLSVLDKKCELEGRSFEEFHALQSLPGCRRQGLHWDFDPDMCEGLQRKPVSAFLTMEYGTRLHVRDEAENVTIPVVLEPGDILVFEGDVAHAGAAYVSRNTRVHVYGDVPQVTRNQGFTWSRRRAPSPD